MDDKDRAAIVTSEQNAVAAEVYHRELVKEQKLRREMEAERDKLRVSVMAEAVEISNLTAPSDTALRSVVTRLAKLLEEGGRMTILSNQRRCLDCGDEPWSRHRHDYRTCTCGKVMVDGGQEYLRHSLAGEGMYIVVSDEHSKGLTEVIERDNLTPFGKVCHLALYLRDEMGINIGDSYEEDS